MKKNVVLWTCFWRVSLHYGDYFNRYRLVALHSTLKDQAAAFTVPPSGVRKVLQLVLGQCSLYMTALIWNKLFNLTNPCLGRSSCLQTSLRLESPFQMWCSSSTPEKQKRTSKQTCPCFFFFAQFSVYTICRCFGYQKRQQIQNLWFFLISFNQNFWSFFCSCCCC